MEEDQVFVQIGLTPVMDKKADRTDSLLQM
jgi:hypothetical protein